MVKITLKNKLIYHRDSYREFLFHPSDPVPGELRSRNDHVVDLRAQNELQREINIYE